MNTKTIDELIFDMNFATTEQPYSYSIEKCRPFVN